MAHKSGGGRVKQDEPGVRAVTEEAPAQSPRDPAGPAPADAPGDGSAAGAGPGLSLDTVRAGGSRLLEFESNSVLVATIVLAVAIGVLHPEFFAWSQIKDVLAQSVYVGILAAGMAFLISMREIDLSVGSVFGLSLIASALLMRGGMNPWLAALIGVLLGGGMGLVNAALVQVITIPAIVATLATLSMFRGLALALSDGQQVTGLPVQSSFFTFLGGDMLGLPVSVWVLIVTGIVLTAVLRLTPFGYRVRSIGSNPEAATFSGISIPRVRVQALVLMGLLGGLSGMMGLAFFQSGDPNVGSGFELQAIAAAVIGGTPLRGGSATVVGAMFGAILLGVVNSGLVYFNVPINWSAFATGAVILAAVSLDSLLRRRRRGQRSGLALTVLVPPPGPATVPVSRRVSMSSCLPRSPRTALSAGFLVIAPSPSESPREAARTAAARARARAAAGRTPPRTSRWR
jgi:ribose transport system permease protein